MQVRWLALLPFFGILVGIEFVNRVTPLVFGMPLVLAWVVGWVVLSAVIMGIIYLCDPANRDSATGLGASDAPHKQTRYPAGKHS